MQLLLPQNEVFDNIDDVVVHLEVKDYDCWHCTLAINNTLKYFIIVTLIRVDQNDNNQRLYCTVPMHTCMDATIIIDLSSTQQ